jgi:hypothetical protein
MRLYNIYDNMMMRVMMMLMLMLMMMIMISLMLMLLCGCDRLITEKEREGERAAHGEGTAHTSAPVAPIGFWEAVMLPNVLSYAIAFDGP